MFPRTLACTTLLAAAGCATDLDTAMTDTPVDAVVTAAFETQRVAGSGDAADDPAIWIAPDPTDSLIIGTDKTAGLYSFDLDGAVRQFLPAGRLNNVDLRDGFVMDGEERVLIAASDRTLTALALFVLDPGTGDITSPEGGSVPLDLTEPYGICIGRVEGELHAYVNSKDGAVLQLHVISSGDGVSAEVVRRLAVPTQPEGCVVDDRTATLYLGEEGGGVWRFDARAEGSTEGELVIPVDGRTLVADLEGVAVYPVGEDAGWLAASSQGDSAFVFYALPGLDYVGRVRVTESEDGVDEVTGTDGIEVTPAALPGLPQGALIVQDDIEDTGGQNFKVIDWRALAPVLQAE